MESADPPDPPDPNGELSTAVPIRDGRDGRGVLGGGCVMGRGAALTPSPFLGAERCGGGSPVPPPPPRPAVQTATLCDLLASTAVRLCPGRPAVRMAFAPVASALHSVSAAKGGEGGKLGGGAERGVTLGVAPPTPDPPPRTTG